MNPLHRALFNLIVIHSSIVFAAAQAGERITADRILKIIEKKEISTIDELLPDLPAELRENYSLVYGTRNTAQHASELTPRVILFSDDGGFQLAFTGDESVQGGNRLEMITQQSDGSYSFSQVVLEKGKAPSLELNPAFCKSCHGKVPRPIWDAYPFWPGVYGSDHDKLKPAGNSLYKGEEDAEKFLRESREIASLNEFKRLKAGRDRYRHLRGLADADYTHLADLNAHYSNTLVESGARQVMIPLLNHPDFSRYRDSFTAWYGPGPYDYLRPNQFNLHKWHIERVPGEDSVQLYAKYEAIQKQRTEELERYYRRVEERMTALDPKIKRAFKERAIAHVDQDAFSFLELLYQRLGISEELWSSGIQGIPRYSGGRKSSQVYLWKAAKEAWDAQGKSRPGQAAQAVFTPVENRYRESGLAAKAVRAGNACQGALKRALSRLIGN